MLHINNLTFPCAGVRCCAVGHVEVKTGEDGWLCELRVVTIRGPLRQLVDGVVSAALQIDTSVGRSQNAGMGL